MIKKIVSCALLILGVLTHQAYSQTPSSKLKIYLDKEVAAEYKKADYIDYKNLISCLGALAGQAVQEGLRVELIQKKKIPEQNVFAVVETKSKEKYYFGPFFDEFLFKSERGTDFWSVLTAGYTQAENRLPSIDKMAEHNAKLVGDKSYGRHSVDNKYQPSESPISSLNNHWSSVYSELQKERLHPLSWGWEIASYTSENILKKDIGIPKEVAIQLFMESAISMSKYNLKQ